MLNGKPYENLFRYAADDIGRQAKHPGQSIPGLWSMSPDRPGNVVVVAIVAAALSRIAKEHDVDFVALISRYTELSTEVPFRAVGAPDEVARVHLKDVSRLAANLRTQARAEERLQAADRAAMH